MTRRLKAGTHQINPYPIRKAIGKVVIERIAILNKIIGTPTSSRRYSAGRVVATASPATTEAYTRISPAILSDRIAGI
jgi:hypothetical protein